jgi:asparagine synthase (glutamine-hydrolysing)
VYQHGNNILCHERLAIVGLDNGAQPLLNEKKTLALSVNGEIYNYPALHTQLSTKHKFLTHSDCEPILYLVRELGIAHWISFSNVYHSTKSMGMIV